MIVAEQTVVLGARVVAFTAVCSRCLDDGHTEPWPTVDGRLRIGDDHDWAECHRGHRIRVAREGRGVHAELTTPLW
jgi:hypothetical protein